MNLASNLLHATIYGILFTMLVGMVRSWAWAIDRMRQGEPLLPPSTPRTVPWGYGSILLVLLTWFLVNLGVMSVYTVLTHHQPSPPQVKAGPAPRPGMAPLSFTEQMLLLSMANGILLLVIPAIVRLTSGARLRDLGLQNKDVARNILNGVVAFLLVSPVVYSTNFLAVLVWKPRTHPVEKMFRSEPSQGIAQLAILSAVLLAPAAEELIFRAIVQSWLIKIFTRSRSPSPSPSSPLPDDFPSLADGEIEPVFDKDQATHFPQITQFAPLKRSSSDRASTQAIVLTSSLFALVHLPQWPAPLSIFLLSLGLGIVYQRTGSLIASFVMHALFNSLGTLVLLGGPAEGAAANRKANVPAGCVITNRLVAARQHDRPTDRHVSDRKRLSVRFSVGADCSD